MSYSKCAQIAIFMWPTWGPPGSCRPQVGPMLAPWTLLSGCFQRVSVSKRGPWSNCGYFSLDNIVPVLSWGGILLSVSIIYSVARLPLSGTECNFPIGLYRCVQIVRDTDHTLDISLVPDAPLKPNVRDHGFCCLTEWSMLKIEEYRIATLL